MSDKERMISGEYYNTKDIELIKDRKATEEKVSIYNTTASSDYDFRIALLADLFSSVGDGVNIYSPFHCQYGYNITLGDNITASHNLTIMDAATVKIGNNVIIGPNVNIITNDIPTNTRDRIFGTESAKSVLIRDNVSIGAGVTIYPGVTIGTNAVILPGTVVDKNISLNSIVGGNPCRIVRELTNEEIF